MLELWLWKRWPATAFAFIASSRKDFWSVDGCVNPRKIGRRAVGIDFGVTEGSLGAASERAPLAL